MVTGSAFDVTVDKGDVGTLLRWVLAQVTDLSILIEPLSAVQPISTAPPVSQICAKTWRLTATPAITPAPLVWQPIIGACRVAATDKRTTLEG